MAGSWNGTTYTGDDTPEVVKGGAANETFFMQGGDDVATGGAGDDYIDTGFGSDRADGGAGDDKLIDYSNGRGVGLVGKDTLIGGDGADTIYAFSPDTGDVLDGGAGTDFVSFDFSAYRNNEVINFQFGTHTSILVNQAQTYSVNNIESFTFFGGSGTNVVTGSGGHDYIVGGGSEDFLSGGGGDDELSAQTGIMHLDGGTGTDVADFDLTGASAAIVIKGGKPVDLGAFGTIKNVERYGLIHTGSGADEITLTQTTGVEIYANAGDDILKTGAGDDDIHAGDGADNITTGAGDDFVNPLTGADVVHLGAGNDELTYSDFDADSYTRNDPDAGDVVFGEDGDDEIATATGSDDIDGGAGDDLVFSGKGSDTVHGRDGDDTLNGESGGGRFFGDGGDDRISTGGGLDDDDKLLVGDELADGGGGNDSIGGGIGKDTMSGGAGDDVITEYGPYGASYAGSDQGNIYNPGTIDAKTDVIDGGVGDDTLSFDMGFFWATQKIAIALGATTRIVADGKVIATATSMERLDVSANGYGDQTISGGALDDRVLTGYGDDKLTTGGGDDVVDGSGGSDTIDAGAGSDVVQAEAGGKDAVSLGAGDDRLALEGHQDFYGPAAKGAGVYDGGAGADSLTIDASLIEGFAFDGKTITSDGVKLGTVKGFESVTISSYGSDGFGFGGSTGADSVTGGSGDDTLGGAAGDDTITGGDGLDKLTGGDGDDRIVGGPGADTLSGGGGNDSLTARFDALDSVDGGEGDDFVAFDFLSVTGPIVMKGDLSKTATLTLAGVKTATLASVEQISLNGSAANDVLIGGTGADTLSAQGGVDKVTSGAGDDVVSANLDAGGVDEISLGRGTDRFSTFATTDDDVRMTGAVGDFGITLGGAQAAHVTGAESVFVFSGGGDDSLFGGDLDDDLESGAGSDTLSGGGGDDYLFVAADAGKDLVDGGAGDDQLGIDAFDSARALKMTAGASGVDVLSGGKTLVHATHVEIFNVTGGNGNDTLLGLDGDDFLSGYAGLDRLSGSAGNDTLYGGVDDDALTGGAGDDQLRGGLGVDSIDGGAGADTLDLFEITGTSVEITLAGAKQSRVIVDGVATDRVTNVENIFGSYLAEKITGDAGDNLLRGGGGIDTLDGGGGSDTADYSDQFGGVVAALAGAKQITVSINGLANDLISNIENLKGGIGADSLSGDRVDNRLDGGFGADTVAGGLGRDVFVFSTTLGGTNVDAVTDFSVKDDAIALSRSIFTDLDAGGVKAAAFFAGAAAHDGDDRILYDAKSGALLYDADGKGGVDALQFATLDAGIKLTAADFLVV